MGGEVLARTPEEIWERIATPEKKAKIVKGVVRTAMSLNISPEVAGEVFANLDEHTANGIAYLFSGVADGETVRRVGRKLKGAN